MDLPVQVTYVFLCHLPLNRARHLAEVRIYASLLYSQIVGLRGRQYLIAPVDVLMLLLRPSGDLGQQPPVFVNFVRHKAVWQLSAPLRAPLRAVRH